MKKRIECVLFIDDDRATNYINKKIAQRDKRFGNICVAEGGSDGLNYLKEAYSSEATKPIPQVIFLDINMPAMNGWEFLKAYDVLEDEIKKEIKIFMLSTSTNQEDIEKAQQYDYVHGFFSKPLTNMKLEKLINDHFYELV